MPVETHARRRSRRWITVIAGAFTALPALSYTVSIASPSRTSRQISIDASPETVWAVLTDFDSYPRWNPVITQISGTPQLGETLAFTMTADGGEMNFRPKVLVADPARELRWLGRLWIPGLADGEHSFLLSSKGGRTVLMQEELFTGALAPLLPFFMDLATTFGRSNEAIRVRSEEPENCGQKVPD